MAGQGVCGILGSCTAGLPWKRRGKNGIEAKFHGLLRGLKPLLSS